MQHTRCRLADVRCQGQTQIKGQTQNLIQNQNQNQKKVKVHVSERDMCGSTDVSHLTCELCCADGRCFCTSDGHECGDTSCPLTCVRCTADKGIPARAHGDDSKARTMIHPSSCRIGWRPT